MNIKLDESLPRSLVGLFEQHGHDVETVFQEGLNGKPDPFVMQAAGMESRMLLTLDRRLADIRQYPPGYHHGILIIRTHNYSAAALERLCMEFLTQHRLETFAGCILVLQEDGIRVRRPSSP